MGLPDFKYESEENDSIRYGKVEVEGPPYSQVAVQEDNIERIQKISAIEDLELEVQPQVETDLKPEIEPEIEPEVEKTKSVTRNGFGGWMKQKAGSAVGAVKKAAQGVGNYFAERKAKKEAKKRLSDISTEMLQASKSVTTSESAEATERLEELREKDNVQAKKSGAGNEGARFNRLSKAGIAFLLPEEELLDENGDNVLREAGKITTDETGQIIGEEATEDGLITDARQDFFSKTPFRKKISNVLGIGTTILDGLARSTKNKLKEDKQATTAINDFIFKDFLHISNPIATITDDETNKDMDISSKDITILGQSGVNNMIDRTKLKTGVIKVSYDATKDSYSTILRGGSIDATPLSFLEITATNIQLSKDGNNLSSNNFTASISESNIQSTSSPLAMSRENLLLSQLDISNEGVSWNSKTIYTVGELIDDSGEFEGDLILEGKQKTHAAAATLQIEEISLTDINMSFHIPSSASLFQKTNSGWSLKDEPLISNAKQSTLFNYLDVKEAVYTLGTDYNQKITASIDTDNYTGEVDHLNITKLQGGLTLNKEDSNWKTLIESGELEFSSSGFFSGVANDISFDATNRLTASSASVTLNDKDVMTPATITLTDINMDSTGVYWSASTKKILLLQFRDLILFETSDLSIEKNAGEGIIGKIDYNNVIPNLGLLDKITIESKDVINRIDNGWDTSNLNNCSDQKISLFGGKITISGVTFSLEENKAVVQGVGNLESSENEKDKNIGTANVSLIKEGDKVTNEFQDVNILMGNLVLKLGKGSYNDNEGYVFENISAGILSKKDKSYVDRVQGIANEDLNQRVSDFHLHGFGIQVKKFSISSKGVKIEDFSFVKEKLEFGYGKRYKVSYNLQTQEGSLVINKLVNMQRNFIDFSVPIFAFPPGLASVDLGFMLVGGFKVDVNFNMQKSKEDKNIMVTRLQTDAVLSASADLNLGLHLGPRGVAELATEAYAALPLMVDVHPAAEKKFNLGEEEMNLSNLDLFIDGGAEARFQIGVRLRLKSMFFNNKTLFNHVFKDWLLGRMGFSGSYVDGVFQGFHTYVNPGSEQGRKIEAKKDGGGLKEYLKNTADLYHMLMDINEEKNESKIRGHMLDANQWILNSSGQMGGADDKDDEASEKLFPTRKNLLKMAKGKKKTLVNDKKEISKMLKTNQKAVSEEIIKKRPLVMGRIMKHTLRSENVLTLLKHTAEQDTEFTTKKIKDDGKKGVKIGSDVTWEQSELANVFGLASATSSSYLIFKTNELEKLIEEKAKLVKKLKNVSAEDSESAWKKVVAYEIAIENVEKRTQAYNAFISADHELKSGAMNIHRPEVLEQLDSYLNVEEQDIKDSESYAIIERDDRNLELLKQYRSQLHDVFSNRDTAALLEGLNKDALKKLFSGKSAKEGHEQDKENYKVERDVDKLNTNEADGRGGFGEVNKHDFNRTQYYMDKLQSSNKVVIRKTNRITKYDEMAQELETTIKQYEELVVNPEALDEGMPTGVKEVTEQEVMLEIEQATNESNTIKDKTNEMLGHLEDLANDRTEELKEFKEIDEYTKD